MRFRRPSKRVGFGLLFMLVVSAGLWFTIGPQRLSGLEKHIARGMTYQEVLAVLGRPSALASNGEFELDGKPTKLATGFWYGVDVSLVVGFQDSRVLDCEVWPITLQRLWWAEIAEFVQGIITPNRARLKWFPLSGVDLNAVSPPSP